MDVDELKRAMQEHVRQHEEDVATGRYAEMRRQFLARVSPTYIENWPSALCNLSIAQVDVPLTVDDAKALMSNNGEWAECLTPPQDISGIERRVRDAASRFPAGAFVRLGSRSPKDSWLGHSDGGMKVLPSDERTLRYLLDSSERIHEDLDLAVTCDYQPHLFVRQWVDIPKWSEFRCFMRDRRLVGISQYYYHDGAFAEITSDPSYIEWSIGQFFPAFRNACHLDDVVFDVFLKVRQNGNQRATDVRLLEINPFFEMTDPCLYGWRNGGKFEEPFKFVA